MKFFLTLAFILIAIILGVISAIGYAAEKLMEACIWLGELCAAGLDLLIDKITLPSNTKTR